jgi:hypothetical protein
MVGCVQTTSLQTESLERVSMGASMGVHDVSCTRIRESIAQQLSKLDIPYEWRDKNEGMLSVGPFEEDIGFANTYSRIRQSYYLEITCSDELTTSISGDAILEGLGKTGQWVWINDPVTIEKHSMWFLQRLDL